MLELFKGQISLDQLKYEMTYKEALILRNARMERLKRENDEIEKMRNSTNDKYENNNIRNEILRR